MSQQADNPFSAVIDAAAEAERSANKDLFPEIEGRLAALEIYAEDSAKRELADAELTRYISDLRGELRDLKTLRTIYGFVAIAMVAALMAILMSIVFVVGSPLYTLPPYPASALIVTLLTGIVLLVVTLAKGVHRPSGDFAKEEPLPMAPQFLIELFKQAKG